MAESPTDKVLPISSEENDKLTRWRSEFQQDFRSHCVWHKHKREWERFYDGDQLTDEEKEKLRERGQPEVVINRIKPRMDGIIGDFLGRRVMMRARDRGSADFEKGKHITEALRYIEDQNRFDESEALVAEDLCIGGVGWYKITLGFDFLEPEIKIAHRPNDDVVVDRHCRQRNLSDAKRLYETIWAEAEDLIEVWPEHKQFIEDAISREKEPFEVEIDSKANVNRIGDEYAESENVSPDTGYHFETFVDPKRRRIRLINIWERVQKRVEFAFHANLKGAVKDVTDFTKEQMTQFKRLFPDASYFTRTRWELNSGIFIGNKILEDKQNVRPHDSDGKFPFSRAIGHVERGSLRMPYGLVKQYVDPQKEYNKRRSKLLHKLNVNQIEAEEGAFAHNDIERIRTEAAKPDGVILYKTGRQMKINRTGVEQGDVFMLQLTQTELEDAGVSSEFVGTENQQLSGKAIAQRQVSGLKMLRPFFAALRSARRDAFTIVLEEMQQYWTSEKLIKITDDPEAGAIILNQRVTDADGRETIVNDLRLGKYDIKIDEDAETPNQRTENFEQLIALGELAVKAGEPFPLERAIMSSNLPDKKAWMDEIAKRRQEQMQMMQAQLLAQAQAGAVPQNGQ